MIKSIIFSHVLYTHTHTQTFMFIDLPHDIVCESNNSVMVSVPAYFVVCRHLPQLTCPCNVLEHSVLHLTATFVKDICTL